QSATTQHLVLATSGQIPTVCHRTFRFLPHLGQGVRRGRQLHLLPAIKQRSWCLILPRVVPTSFLTAAIRRPRISPGEIALPTAGHFPPPRQTDPAHVATRSPAVAW